MIKCYLAEGRHVGINPKIHKAYDGPLPVVEKRSPVNFSSQMGKNGPIRNTNHNKLKPYRGQNAPKWENVLANNVK
ncbi:hypothetical protein DPMN_159970 [Dreissena polymorpha]|uniref:Uncharacterized protein n=1 Tax=Dreissena polymorpha TaxID=45954 RepID=A0A9D4IR70_DREPO|nr:hypothetical protein DPMN_159970 [Dreissena polymorpha]